MRKTSSELAHRVPSGQVLTDKWPVLTYGLHGPGDAGDAKMRVEAARRLRER